MPSPINLLSAHGSGLGGLWLWYPLQDMGVRRFFLALVTFAGLVIGAVTTSWLVLWLSLRTTTVRVPDVQGQPPESAAGALQRVGLVPRVQVPVPDPKYPVGLVAKQKPGPGFQLKRGSPVFLYPSSGTGGVLVPDFRGLPPTAVVAQLEELGLAEGTTAEVSGEAKGFVVVAQVPPPGASVATGGRVSLLVNRGLDRPRVVMPDLVGEPVQEVKQLLGNWGFRLDAVEYVTYPGLPPGTVVKQVPPPGGPAFLGGGVLLWAAR
ncbi:MAG: PASTA domain-containing protein [Thermoanaerobaculaceae bacterium]